MAPRSKKKVEESEPVVYERVKCRFRLKDSDNWSKGKVVVGRENPDGSLTIIDGFTGGMRAIMAEHVQVEKKGPRGGLTWVAYE